MKYYETFILTKECSLAEMLETKAIDFLATSEYIQRKGLILFWSNDNHFHGYILLLFPFLSFALSCFLPFNCESNLMLYVLSSMVVTEQNTSVEISWSFFICLPINDKNVST